MLVCPLVFKTSDRGEEPLRWVRFPHIPAKPDDALRVVGFFIHLLFRSLPGLSLLIGV